MTKPNRPIHRRTQHVGVLSDGIWAAHDRGIGANEVPTTANTKSTDSETGADRG